MADQKMKKNIEDQLTRLLTQLQDLEDMREDLDDDEYVEGKSDTLKQMEEFEQSLQNMMTGDMTMLSELGAAQIAIQTAIRQANPASAKQLFSSKEAIGLRRRQAALEEDHRLGKISSLDFKAQSVEVLRALEKAGEVLSEGERGSLISLSGRAAYSAAPESIDSSVMKTATQALGGL